MEIRVSVLVVEPMVRWPKLERPASYLDALPSTRQTGGVLIQARDWQAAVLDPKRRELHCSDCAWSEKRIVSSITTASRRRRR